jgi:hypothetical protein
MPAVPSAVPSAASAAAVDAVNSPAGYPATPVWPGAVDPAAYSDTAGTTSKQLDLADGAPAPDPFAASLPAGVAPGGGYQDTSWATGTDAPQAPWDSLAGAPFAPSGPIGPADTHGTDTGAVYQAEHVTPPAIGRLARRSPMARAMNLEWGFDPATGERASADAGRGNYDQYQDADCGAYDPWEPGYAERPVFNNLAWENPEYGGPGMYDPSGALPDMSVWDYGAQAYQQPPDPAVSTAQPAAAGASSDGWVLG